MGSNPSRQALSFIGLATPVKAVLSQPGMFYVVAMPMLSMVTISAHPLGIRGVGEVSIVPPPAAAANAIYRAVGIRMTQLPMSPPRVLKAIHEKTPQLENQAAAAD